MTSTQVFAASPAARFARITALDAAVPRQASPLTSFARTISRQTAPLADAARRIAALTLTTVPAQLPGSDLAALQLMSARVALLHLRTSSHKAAAHKRASEATGTLEALAGDPNATDAVRQAARRIRALLADALEHAWEAVSQAPGGLLTFQFAPLLDPSRTFRAQRKASTDRAAKRPRTGVIVRRLNTPRAPAALATRAAHTL